MTEVAAELMRLGGGDPFGDVAAASRAHQPDHSCGLHTAGPEVMQLASSYVRAAMATRVLDLGCGLGYSSLWLAAAVGRGGEVIAIDDDPGHVAEARCLTEAHEDGARIRFVVGTVAEVLPTLAGPFDAVHDDAWFASAPDHLDVMIDRLRRGGVLTMPNWFLLVDAISGRPRRDWERYAGATWAADTMSYARQLAARRDLSVNWITEPPLGVAVKL